MQISQQTVLEFIIKNGGTFTRTGKKTTIAAQLAAKMLAPPLAREVTEALDGLKAKQLVTVVTVDGQQVITANDRKGLEAPSAEVIDFSRSRALDTAVFQVPHTTALSRRNSQLPDWAQIKPEPAPTVNHEPEPAMPDKVEVEANLVADNGPVFKLTFDQDGYAHNSNGSLAGTRPSTLGRLTRYAQQYLEHLDELIEAQRREIKRLKTANAVETNRANHLQAQWDAQPDLAAEYRRRLAALQDTILALETAAVEKADEYNHALAQSQADHFEAQQARIAEADAKAQVEALQGRIVSLQHELETATTKANEPVRQAQQLSQEVTRLRRRLEELQAELTEARQNHELAMVKAQKVLASEVEMSRTLSQELQDARSTLHILLDGHEPNLMKMDHCEHVYVVAIDPDHASSSGSDCWALSVVETHHASNFGVPSWAPTHPTAATEGAGRAQRRDERYRPNRPKRPRKR